MKTYHPLKKFNEFEILTDRVKITLKKGVFAYCNLKDWNKLKKHKWYAAYKSTSRKYEVFTNIGKGWGNQRILTMPSAIYPDNMIVKRIHLNGNPLDNRRGNFIKGNWKVLPEASVCAFKLKRKPMRKVSGTGEKYIYNQKDGAFRVKIGRQKKILIDKYASTLDQAIEIRNAAVREFHI